MGSQRNIARNRSGVNLKLNGCLTYMHDNADMDAFKGADNSLKVTSTTTSCACADNLLGACQSRALKN
eukprot:1420189-Amphidinium_carterae.1